MANSSYRCYWQGGLVADRRLVEQLRSLPTSVVTPAEFRVWADRLEARLDDAEERDTLRKTLAEVTEATKGEKDDRS